MNSMSSGGGGGGAGGRKDEEDVSVLAPCLPPWFAYISRPQLDFACFLIPFFQDFRIPRTHPRRCAAR